MRLKSFRHRIGLDRAVAFTLLARGWAMFAGVCNIILISRFLTPAEQGYFYTFASLVAIQVVFELGFSLVILQMAAHERTRLTQFDNHGIAGDPIAHSRLASILQKTVRWYSRAGVVMGIGLLFIGVYFFTSHPKPGEPVHWLMPWCLDAIMAAVAFMVDPVVCFLEGSGWVTDVARLRFPQALLGSLLGWSCLLLHRGLFAPAMMIAGQAIVALYFVLKVHGRLVFGLLRHHVGNLGISWRTEVWPFQWRVAVTWASSYFIFQFFNPVLFAYTGPVIAGRMGMSLNVRVTHRTCPILRQHQGPALWFSGGNQSNCGSGPRVYPGHNSVINVAFDCRSRRAVGPCLRGGRAAEGGEPCGGLTYLRPAAAYRADEPHRCLPVILPAGP